MFCYCSCEIMVLRTAKCKSCIGLTGYTQTEAMTCFLGRKHKNLVLFLKNIQFLYLLSCFPIIHRNMDKGIEYVFEKYGILTFSAKTTSHEFRLNKIRGTVLIILLCQFAPNNSKLNSVENSKICTISRLWTICRTCKIGMYNL